MATGGVGASEIGGVGDIALGAASGNETGAEAPDPEAPNGAPHSRQNLRPGVDAAPQRAQFAASARTSADATGAGLCASEPETEEPRSAKRFPQFVQKIIPAGLSQPQLPQRIHCE